MGVIMLYTRLTKKALHIMFNTHRDQLDKGALPYVFHPFEVAEQMDDEVSVCVALLHDTIEDGKITPEYLDSVGFSEEIVDAVVLLTHKKGVPYDKYIKRIKHNPLAKKVKIADLRHNSNTDRLEQVTDETKERLEKYARAIEVLEGEDINEDDTFKDLTV